MEKGKGWDFFLEHVLVFSTCTSSGSPGRPDEPSKPDWKHWGILTGIYFTLININLSAGGLQMAAAWLSLNNSACSLIWRPRQVSP